jgi:hypothetical protein
VEIFADQLVAAAERGEQLIDSLPAARWDEIEEAMDGPMRDLNRLFKSVSKVAATNADIARLRDARKKGSVETLTSLDTQSGVDRQSS